MAKKKGNRESKKPKKQSDGTKKKKKDPNRFDGLGLGINKNENT